MQVFQATDYRGKRVRLSGYVKSKAVEKYAGLWMRVDGQQNQVLSFDNMQNRPIRETTDWKKYEVVLNVPDNSADIAFGVLLEGIGQVWVNNLQIAVVGTDVPTTDLKKSRRELPNHPVNLNFDSVSDRF